MSIPPVTSSRSDFPLCPASMPGLRREAAAIRDAGRVPGAGDRRPGGRSPALLADRVGVERFPSRPDSSRRRWAGRATVLDLDKDFDLIAAITGRPVDRLDMPSLDGT